MATQEQEVITTEQLFGQPAAQEVLTTEELFRKPEKKNILGEWMKLANESYRANPIIRKPKLGEPKAPMPIAKYGEQVKALGTADYWKSMKWKEDATDIAKALHPFNPERIQSAKDIFLEKFKDSSLAKVYRKKFPEESQPQRQTELVAATPEQLNKPLSELQPVPAKPQAAIEVARDFVLYVPKLMKEFVDNPVQTFHDKPVQLLLMLSPFAKKGGKRVMGKLAEKASIDSISTGELNSIFKEVARERPELARALEDITKVSEFQQLPENIKYARDTPGGMLFEDARTGRKFELSHPPVLETKAGMKQGLVKSYPPVDLPPSVVELKPGMGGVGGAERFSDLPAMREAMPVHGGPTPEQLAGISVERPPDFLQKPGMRGNIAESKPDLHPGGELKGLATQWVDESGRPISPTEAFRKKKVDPGIDSMVEEKAGKLVETLVRKPPEDRTPESIMAESSAIAKQTLPKDTVTPKALETDAGIRDAYSDNARTPEATSFIDGVRKKWDNFRSPDRVMSRDAFSAKIYDMAESADRAKKMWVFREMKQYEAASRGIHDGSPIDTGVFKVRNNRLDIKDVLRSEIADVEKYGITPAELAGMKKNPFLATHWAEFLGNFDILLRKYGTSRIGDSREAELWREATTARKTGVSPEFTKSLSSKEAEIFDLYQRRIQDYVPHIFDKVDLMGLLQKELDATRKKAGALNPGSPEYTKVMGRVAQIESSINTVNGGGTPLYQELPKRVYFRFFEPRKDMPGYQVSSTKAYRSYLFGIARKIFDEPVLRDGALMRDMVSADMKPYTNWFLRKFGGLENKEFSGLFNTVKSFQWFRTLGMNPRSAVTNWTQKVNTVATEGPYWSTRGYLYGFTDAGKALFERSGLKGLAPEAMITGEVGQGGVASMVERLRRASSFMFSKVEEGNLKHAFLSRYLKNINKGMAENKAFVDAVKLAERTQFRYGKIGTPRALSGPGGVVFQFWSYPIKQMEFLSSLWRENPAKLAGWIALAEGAKYTAQELLDLDLSNSLGLVGNWGELFTALQFLSEGDVRATLAHLSQADVGSGIVPYGLGPAVTQALNIQKKVGDPATGLVDLLSELEPITFQRVRQNIRAGSEGKDQAGKYPIRAPYGDELMYRETEWEGVARLMLAKPYSESKAQMERSKYRINTKIEAVLMNKIIGLALDGKIEDASKIAQKYGLNVSRESIVTAIEKKTMTPEERRKLSTNMSRFMDYMERGKVQSPRQPLTEYAIK